MDSFFTKLRLQTRGIIDNRSFNGSSSREGSPPLSASSPKKQNPFAYSTSPTPRTVANKRFKIVLVVDGSKDTDWAAVFNDQKIEHGLYDLRVEQAEFSKLNLASYSDTGTVVDIQVKRGDTVVVRSFRPDIVLLRQPVHGLGKREDWRNLLFGLKYGNIPSINSLDSIYNFTEKPWVYAQLLQIQRKLGNDAFPLISQAYYPNHREMLITPQFPAVVKVGHANSGYGKVCVQNHRGFQDISSIVAVADTYATTEPFIEGAYDIRIQKIGEHYRVYKRKSLSDNWKTNMGSAVVEEIALTERYKLWADECAKMFGGLDILCVEAIQTADGKEYIIEVNDTGMKLFSETKEEDTQRIADLVMKKMKELFPPSLENLQPRSPSASLLVEALKVVGNPHDGTNT